jgi:YidC/Oxa1 family membrane protein insertase
MDRRFLLAIILMIVIAVAPSILFKQTRRPPPPVTTAAPEQPAPPAQVPLPTLAPTQHPVAPAPAETVLVTSDLFSYGFSTRGAELVQATATRYRSMALGDRGQPVQLVAEDGGWLGLTLVVGSDTLRLDDWTFTPSAPRLSVSGPSELRLTARRGSVDVNLLYRFRPDDYRVEVAGTVSGIGPNGGLLLVGLGSGLRQTEADSVGNHNEYGVVTKQSKSELTRFSRLQPGLLTTFSGPFEWVAVKSKYFVTGLLALDTAGARISGLTALAHPNPAGKPVAADIVVSLPLNSTGTFSYTFYAGPMEQPRLARLGHEFDDVNPYGWPGFRTIIRPVAVGVRWLLVWMHERLSLAYGVVLIFFGILVRIILWPLNQRGMRAGLKMQALQPEMQEIQEKYKNDPQRLQQEVMNLYKKHGANPFSGCWPMLLPWPVLLALFFVFQNTIELRGQSFLWLPDLSLRDPLYILPVLMGISLFAVSKVGQMGMEPNPQMKMMLYLMPGMMTVLFLNFASGLNLYYFIQNVVSVPQQWLLAKERIRLRPPPAPKAGPPSRATKKQSE